MLAVARLSPGQRGASLYLIASLVFITSDSLAKVILTEVPILPVMLGRNLVYVVAVVLVMGRTSPGSAFRTRRPGIQVVRGLLMFGSTATWFWALSLLPLAEASTLSSTAPLMTIAMAGPLLRERVTRTDVAGGLIGFAGVLLLMGIDPARIDLAMLVPLANAAILALFFVLTRSLRDEPPAATMFWSGSTALLASVAVALVATPSGPAPTAIDWLGIAVVGVLSMAAHRLLVGAYRWARASDLAPMGYLGVLWAFLVGAAVFSEPITPQAVAGALAIAAGGIVAMRAEPAAVASGMP